MGFLARGWVSAMLRCSDMRDVAGGLVVAVIRAGVTSDFKNSSNVLSRAQ
jgi:hypothetical protein